MGERGAPDGEKSQARQLDRGDADRDRERRKVVAEQKSEDGYGQRVSVAECTIATITTMEPSMRVEGTKTALLNVITTITTMGRSATGTRTVVKVIVMIATMAQAR